MHISWLRDRLSRGLWLPLLVHSLATCWLFGDQLFARRLPYLRDVCAYYYPNYVFLERALSQGVWPLWNPSSDAGAPFLIAYPVELLAVFLAGARGALALGSPLHLLLGMCGMSVVASRCGLGMTARCAAGMFFGLSGYVLSCANLFELFHAVCWAPWVVAAFLALWDAPSPRRVAALGAAVAMQITTLGAETILQTGLLCLMLVPLRLGGRRVLALLAAVLVAAFLAAPALAGAYGLIEGTRRAGGLSPEEAFAFSLHPVALLDMFLPRFLGNVHAFGDKGFWGQSFFPSQFPYFLSLYMGPGLILLAAQAGGWRRRPWLVAALGVLLALGSWGGIAPLLSPLMRFFRTPAKSLFLTTFAVSLLAAHGVQRCMVARARIWVLLPGGGLTLVALLLAWQPELLRQFVGSALPAILSQNANTVVRQAWPRDFLVSGGLGLGVGLLLWRGKRWASWSWALVALDLLATNTTVNLSTTRAFYELSPGVSRLIATARTAQPYRWLTWALGEIRAPHFNSRTVTDNDVWLYSLDRQLLAPRMFVLDGLEGALDEDRVGWAPEASTLSSDARRPENLKRIAPLLRLANVRWILSPQPLPTGLVTERGIARVPGLSDPLRLYELNGALPRAFWVPKAEVEPDPARRRARLVSETFDPLGAVVLDQVPEGGQASAPPLRIETTRVSFTQRDPHHISVAGATPPGFLVVSEGFHDAWRVRLGERAVPLYRANGRYWAIPTLGGDCVFEATFEPRWRGAAVIACGLGVLAVLGLCLPSRFNTGSEWDLPAPRENSTLPPSSGALAL